MMKQLHIPPYVMFKVKWNAFCLLVVHSNSTYRRSQTQFITCDIMWQKDTTERDLQRALSIQNTKMHNSGAVTAITKYYHTLRTVLQECAALQPSNVPENHIKSSLNQLISGPLISKYPYSKVSSSIQSFPLLPGNNYCCHCFLFQMIWPWHSLKSSSQEQISVVQ